MARNKIMSLFPDLIDDYVCLDIMKQYGVSRERIKKRASNWYDMIARRAMFSVACDHGEILTPISFDEPFVAKSASTFTVVEIRIDKIKSYGHSDSLGNGYYRFVTGQCPKCKTVYAFYVGKW